MGADGAVEQLAVLTRYPHSLATIRASELVPHAISVAYAPASTTLPASTATTWSANEIIDGR